MHCLVVLLRLLTQASIHRSTCASLSTRYNRTHSQLMEVSTLALHTCVCMHLVEAANALCVHMQLLAVLLVLADHSWKHAEAVAAASKSPHQ
jgi:hypothetical protein